MPERSLDSVVQEGLLVDRKWLKQRGFDRPNIDSYLRSGKLEAVVRGIYRKPGPPLKWQNIVYSLSKMGYQVHVGHKTALNYHGYQHYLALGSNEDVRLYCDPSLPHWIHEVNVKSKFIGMAQNPFAESQTGIDEVLFGTWDWPIRYASPERAFLELASTIHTAEEVQFAGLMMEGAGNLKPSFVQLLLGKCRQVKAKRLFLWLAREQNHAWYNHLDRTKIDLGRGKRQIVKGGMLDEEYLITVPRKDENGQAEPLF